MDSFLSEDEKEQNYKLQEAFHKVFETPEGKIVFNALLNDLHYFDICKQKNATQGIFAPFLQEKTSSAILPNWLMPLPRRTLPAGFFRPKKPPH